MSTKIMKDLHILLIVFVCLVVFFAIINLILIKVF